VPSGPIFQIDFEAAHVAEALAISARQTTAD
jgi:hypothetical protein